MKKYLMFTTLAISLIACKEDPTQSPEYKQLQGDESRVESMVQERDSTINDLFASFNRISENLNSIREKQSGLSKRTAGAEGMSAEQLIVADLRAIDSLLTSNKNMMAKLRKDAKNNSARLTELEKTIAGLEQALTEKDAEIAGLKEQLSSTNASLASMIQMYQDKEQQANMQREELNTAFYCVGNKKELTDNGVLTKEGGVVGLGRTTKLNTAGLNMEYFKRVDITTTTEIAVSGKKPKLVTSHPAGSFELSAEKLTITDAAKFWSVSKYLVVQVD